MNKKPELEEASKNLEIFSQYMLAKLQARNEHISNVKERADQTIQLYATIASAAIGLLVLTLSSSQAVYISIGLLSLILIAIGVVGVVFFLRIVTFNMTIDEETARQNWIHRYFGSLNSRLFRYYRGGFDIVHFRTFSWRRSYKDRPFLIAFGVGNAFVFSTGITLLIAAIIIGTAGYPLMANLWWIFLSAFLSGGLFAIITVMEYRRRFARSEYMIGRIGSAMDQRSVPKDIKLAGENFMGADLSGVDLRYADLRGTDLTEADLSGADLSYANLETANLSRSMLIGTHFIGANLADAILAGAHADSGTVWPEGFALADTGLILVD